MMYNMGARKFGASNRYIAHYPCFQANTDTVLKDRSGKGNDGVLNGLSTAEAWLVTSRLSSLASATKHASMPKATLQNNWRWNNAIRDTLFMNFVLDLTVPGSTQEFFGSTFGTAASGFKYSVTAAGAAALAIYDSVNVTSIASGTLLTDAGWAVDHTFALFLDGPNNTYSAYADGVPIVSNVSLATLPVIEPQSGTGDLCFSSVTTGSTGVVSQFSGIHILAAPMAAGRFLYADKLAKRLYRNPTQQVSQTEFL